jgi:mono/diheme cytochrome c family protein
MSRRSDVILPLVLVAGLLLSTFVLVGALQAASSEHVTADAQAPVPDDPDLAAQGRALFLAKGCIVCHHHDDLAVIRREMGAFDFDNVPNLTHLKIDRDYLRRWLRNPRALKPTTEMPNLNLSDPEIEALVAFLTAGN